jgi:hypothetical protein
MKFIHIRRCDERGGVWPLCSEKFKDGTTCLKPATAWRDDGPSEKPVCASCLEKHFLWGPDWEQKEKDYDKKYRREELADIRKLMKRGETHCAVCGIRVLEARHGGIAWPSIDAMIHRDLTEAKLACSGSCQYAFIPQEEGS